MRRAHWDGQQYVKQFGCLETTTYGQVITVHKTARHLNRFTFAFANTGSDSYDASMVVRGEVYAWDGQKAAGSALYESEPRTISYDYDDPSFHKETFKPATLELLPGQYVLFVSIAKDYEQCTGAYTLQWGAMSGSAYRGGEYVYQNNLGDESLWTTTPWVIRGADLALARASAIKLQDSKTLATRVLRWLSVFAPAARIAETYAMAHCRDSRLLAI